MPSLQTVKPAKTNHVRFSGVNGRKSPPENGDHENRGENLVVSQGFPFITPSSRSQNDSLTVETGTPTESRLGNLDSDLELSGQIAVPAFRNRVKAWGNNYDGSSHVEGGEENEPPDGGEGGDKDKGKEQGKSQGQGQRSTPRRGGNLVTFSVYMTVLFF